MAGKDGLVRIASVSFGEATAELRACPRWRCDCYGWRCGEVLLRAAPWAWPWARLTWKHVDYARFEYIGGYPKDLIMFELKKIEFGENGVQLTDDFADPFFEKNCPAVGAVLLKTALPTGEPRRPGSMVLFRQDAGVKVILSSHEDSVQLAVTGETFMACLKALEGQLQSGKPAWRRKNDDGTTSRRLKK